jgi:hypothetical protein
LSKLLIIGQNPGTNSPRIVTELHNASRLSVPIVVFNPLRERVPSNVLRHRRNPIEMTTFGETRITSEYCQVRVGGDVAALKDPSPRRASARTHAPKRTEAATITGDDDRSFGR